MKGATREERIQELKSLRAELLAMREKATDGEADTIESQSSWDSLRKEYAEGLKAETSGTHKMDEAKKELYAQFSNETSSDDDSDDNPVLRRVLVRRR